MEIKIWEDYVQSKYKAQKVTEFELLKEFLTNQNNYRGFFTPYEVTETEIEDKDFYAAYVIDESVIANREVKSEADSGWATMVVFIGSKDKETISTYFCHQSNGLNSEEVSNFYNDIDPTLMQERLTLVKE